MFDINRATNFIKKKFLFGFPSCFIVGNIRTTIIGFTCLFIILLVAYVPDDDSIIQGKPMSTVSIFTARAIHTLVFSLLWDMKTTRTTEVYRTFYGLKIMKAVAGKSSR